MCYCTWCSPQWGAGAAVPVHLVHAGTSRGRIVGYACRPTGPEHLVHFHLRSTQSVSLLFLFCVRLPVLKEHTPVPRCFIMFLGSCLMILLTKFSSSGRARKLPAAAAARRRKTKRKKKMGLLRVLGFRLDFPRLQLRRAE